MTTVPQYHHYIAASNPYRDAGDLEYNPPTWAIRGEFTNSPHPSAALIEAKGELGNGWASCCTPCLQAKDRPLRDIQDHWKPSVAQPTSLQLRLFAA